MRQIVAHFFFYVLVKLLQAVIEHLHACMGWGAIMKGVRFRAQALNFSSL